MTAIILWTVWEGESFRLDTINCEHPKQLYGIYAWVNRIAKPARVVSYLMSYHCIVWYHYKKHGILLLSCQCLCRCQRRKELLIDELKQNSSSCETWTWIAASVCALLYPANTAKSIWEIAAHLMQAENCWVVVIRQRTLRSSQYMQHTSIDCNYAVEMVQPPTWRVTWVCNPSCPLCFSVECDLFSHAEVPLPDDVQIPGNEQEDFAIAGEQQISNEPVKWRELGLSTVRWQAETWQYFIQ